jgi:hypothetical protein
MCQCHFDLLYCYSKIHAVKSLLIDLAEYYSRDDIVNAYNSNLGLFKTEKINLEAFEALRHEHNKRQLFDDTT